MLVRPSTSTDLAPGRCRLHRRRPYHAPRRPRITHVLGRYVFEPVTGLDAFVEVRASAVRAEQPVHLALHHVEVAVDLTRTELDLEDPGGCVVPDRGYRLG